MTRTDMRKWTNWGGNQSFAATRIEVPASEDETIALVRDAVRSGTRIRAAGSGHSFTPIVATDGTLLDLSRVSGLLAADPDDLRAEFLAGTRLADAGAPLWEKGLALANQGDVDQQTLAGATATGTKGSGPNFGSISSTIRAMRLVTGTGDVLDVTEDDPDLLHAAQVSLGLLGVVTRIDVNVVPAYRLREFNEVLSFDEVAERWDELLSTYRHFSFWWMPSDRSAAMYDLGTVPANHCVVKLLQEAAPDDVNAPDVEVGRRVNRAHLIYPDATTVAKFHELEYMVPAERGRDAVEMMRELMVTRFPDDISPLQVRWQRHDEAYLSAQYQRDTVSVSVSGEIGQDYDPFLRTVDGELARFDARPHWGKINYLTADRLPGLYPKFERFQEIRRELDPQELFLNDHLADLFG